MFTSNQYELLDFGQGEKLERFGDVIVRRQTPSVPNLGKRISESPGLDQLRYQRSTDTAAERWTGNFDPSWNVCHRDANFKLRTTPTGQVGIFPEQASNWDWVRDSNLDLQGLNAINLFGYTGGTTLALAQSGAAVTHVDAVKTVVSWARENAAASRLQNHPIRWITEDAQRFVDREVKRGKRYDIFVADPPSFGRGPSGETWKMERDFGKLLSSAALLTDRAPKMIIISCHTPGFDAKRLSQDISHAWDIPETQIEFGTLELTTSCGRKLPSGEFARWHK